MKPRIQVGAGEAIPEVSILGDIESASQLEDYAAWIDKASNMDMKTSRLALGEIGYPALHVSNDKIMEDKIPELTFPESLNTYNKMYMDDSVFKGIFYTSTYLKDSLERFTIIPTRTHTSTPPSAKSVEAAKFVDYCFRNVNGGTWKFWNNVLTYIKNGTSIVAKSYTKVTTGKYKDKYRIKKLSPRALRSVYDWKFDQDQELIGFYQNNGYRDPNNNGGEYDYRTFIPRERFMLFNNDAVLDSPLGRSHLDSVWQLWKYKRAIAHLQSIGLAKNLTGVPVLRVPEDIIAKAAIDPDGQEARSIKVLQRNAAMFHKGENSYILLPSNRFEQANQTYKYDVKLLGVEGGTNNVDLSNILNRIDKAILDAFGCGFVVLGNDGGGSHALAGEKTSIFNNLLESHVRFIEDVINRELIPQLLSLNGYTFEEEDMPLFKAGVISEVSLDELGKFLQRITAVGLDIGDEDMHAWLRSLLPNAPRPNYDKLLSEYGAEDKSRSGDGMKSGMSDSTSNMQSNNMSDLNSDNAS